MFAPSPVETPHLPSSTGCGTNPPTPATLTLCMAYFAYYNPKPPRRGGLLLSGDVRRLASWLGPGCPTSSLRRAPALALHLIWLVAAGWLVHDRSGLRPSPVAGNPSHRLRDSFHDDTIWERWDAAAGRLGLQEVVPPAGRLLARQSLERRTSAPPAPLPLAHWEECAGEEWRLALRPENDPDLLFELLALGDYEPPDRLRLDPLTLAAPPARPLGYERVRRLLETATGAPLGPERRARLREWLGRASACRLRGSLLITTRPELLAELYAVRRLRPYLVEQISPRCALFDRAGLSALRRRLAILGFPLDDSSGGADDDRSLAGDMATAWLGLRILAGLQRYVRLPVAPPHAGLARLAATISPDDAAILECQAERLLADLHATIQGRDAFFPARHVPPPELTAHLRAAIADEQTIAIDYRPPGEAEPRRHVVEPLRLEQREELRYLIAYSHRAETTLTFRLDRLQLVEECTGMTGAVAGASVDR